MPPQYEVMQTRPFLRARTKLLKKMKGSPVAYKANEELEDIMSDLRNGREPKVPLTKRGETRLPKAIKYDLQGYHRAVFVRKGGGLTIAVYVGDHDDVDRYLDQNRGLTFDVVTVKGMKQITQARVSHTTAELAERAKHLEEEDARVGFSDLEESLLTDLGCDHLQKILDQILLTEGQDADFILSMAENLQFPDEQCKLAILDVLLDLFSGDLAKANDRLKREIAEQRGTLDESGTSLIDALRLGEGGTDLVLEGQIDEETLKHVTSDEHFEDWLLFLHPEQRSVVERDYTGPARLMGIAGSGKTCVLIHRAVRLAKKYPDERILVLTYNESLSHLLHYLLGKLCADTSVFERIDVESVEKYLRRMVSAISSKEASRLNELDPKSGEDISLCWKDFCEKPHGLPEVTEIVDAIAQYGDRPPDPAAYLYDELAWIRSGYGRGSRRDYLTADRHGRGIPLPKSTTKKTVAGFEPDARSKILQLLEDFEEYMHAGDLIDREGVTQVAYRLRKRLDQHPEVRYRCVLVDEYQDLSTLELVLLSQVPTLDENGMFYVGDPVQKIFPRHHDNKQAHLNFSGRSSNLRKNFRNTRRILESAQMMVTPFLVEGAESRAPIPIEDIIPPEFTVRIGESPLIFDCASPEQQIQLARSFAGMMNQFQWESLAFCSLDPKTLTAVERTFKDSGIPSQRLGPGIDFRRGGIKIAHLDDIKGYEFSTVVLLDLSDPKRPERDGFPSPSVPWAERWRDAMRIYVAMTRARDQLYLTYISNPTEIIRHIWDTVAEEKPASWIDPEL